MVYTMDDYYPPMKGLLDFRRMEMFADNNGVVTSFESVRSEDGLHVFVALDGRVSEAVDEDDQTALDKAIDIAIAGFGRQ